MVDIQGDIHVSAVAVFRIKIADISNPATRQSHEQAVESFDRFLDGMPVAFDDLNEVLLSEWVSWLFGQGYSYSTANVYLRRLSALYGKVVKEGIVEDSGCFANIKSKLKKASTESVELNSDPDCFKKLRNLVQSDFSKNPWRQLSKDIVLFAVYCGGMAFERLASYRKTDYEGSDKAVLEIVNRYSKPKNRYLFPLNQSRKTPKQLYRTVSDLFSDALKKVGINLSSYGSTTSADLWAVAAVRSGFSGSDIFGCIGSSSKVNPIFSFATPAKLSKEQKTEIRKHVSEVLTQDPDYWYAMQFRRHVGYDMIQGRMKAAGIRFKDSFYPMKEIVRRVGKKMVYKSRPVVPGLLFFQCKTTALPEIFFHLGDIAWGYRQTRNARSPYAIISQKAIETYRNAIGKLSEGMEVYPEGTVQIEEGDKVEIIGGGLMGHPAIFEKEIRETAKVSESVKRIIYRLKLIGNNNIEWVVKVDPRLVLRISDERYEALKEKFL